MRNRPRSTWWDIAQDLDLMICDGGVSGCRKKWSPWIHSKGRVDSIGIIHWDGWNRPSRTDGLRKVLVWAAYAKNREYRQEPPWLGIYHASVWATKTAKEEYHIQLPYEESIADRARVIRKAKEAGVSLKQQHRTVFHWSHWKPSRSKMKSKGGALGG